jgi:protein-S-isoprenylcysteine O-methyltransferase Ste14
MSWSLTGRALFCRANPHSGRKLAVGRREIVRRRPTEGPAKDGRRNGRSQDAPRRILSQREFDERYNLAYVDGQLPRASVPQVLKHYVGSVAIYGGLLLFLTLNPWFRSLISISFKGVTGGQLYGGLFAAYVVLAPVVLLVGRPRSLWASKNLLIWGCLGRMVRTLLRGDLRHEWQCCKPDYRETHALMFLLIKLVFGPLMLYSAMLELRNLSGLLFRFNFQPSGLDRLDVWFLVFVSGVFLLDSTLFFMGYTTEAGFLRNRLRYAETNVFRILVCIVCYAPFNMVTTSFLGPSNYDVRIVFLGELDHAMTWILRGLAVLFLLGMVSSSLFLFTKASNLTNRGIVKSGPYALVRHPGYIAKNLFWLTTVVPLWFADPELPGFTWGSHAIVCGKVLLGLLAWSSLYFLRSITEEQFLRKDPEYVEYCRKVKYRFIPWVY